MLSRTMIDQAKKKMLVERIKQRQSSDEREILLAPDLYFDGYEDKQCAVCANVGPFYCSVDQTIYLDLAFFQELKDRFDAPGDFAMAYVIAHEVGHHVQNELGILDEFYQQRAKLNQTQQNELSVRLELQADYLAGVYAHYIHKEWVILKLVTYRKH